MRAKGYGSYRGRSGLKNVLKVLAVLAVIAVALVVLAVVYLQQFLVVSGDGVRLDLPFFREEDVQTTPTPSSTPTPPIEEPVVIVTPTPPPEPDHLLPVLLPYEALYDGTAASQVEAAGGDCALFDMKADSGLLAFVSQLELAQAAQVSSGDPSINVAIKALNQEEGLYTVARVSCFKDHEASDPDRSLCITTNSGYRWTDPEGVRWISPTSSAVRDYLTSLCVELAQLGFDEILLDNAGYPSEGNLHYIRKGEAYDETQFATVIDGFYAQVADALAEYDVKLSIVTTPEALDGTDTLTGQTAANLARADRLWARDETGALAPVSP